MLIKDLCQLFMSLLIPVLVNYNSFSLPTLTTITPIWSSTFFPNMFTVSFISSPRFYRFGANSPGDSLGKFARPCPPQPELYKQLVSGQRAGEPAGEQL